MNSKLHDTFKETAGRIAFLNRGYGIDSPDVQSAIEQLSQHINKGRSVTVIVAAHNAKETTKISADFVCNGVDDQITIQRAIDSIKDSGGVVSLSEGVFNVNATQGANWAGHTTAAAIRLYSNITLQGQGRSTVIRLGDRQDTSIRNTSVISNASFNETGIVVKNITIDANKQGQDRTNIANPQDWEAINFKGVTRSVIKGCFCFNALGDGIDLDDSSDNLIAENICRDNDGAGIHISFNSPRNIIRNNITSGNGVLLERAGIDILDNSPHCVVEGNISDRDYRGMNIGDTAVITQNTVLNHTAETFGAIHLFNLKASKSIICNNKVEGGKVGITVATASNVIIDGNSFNNQTGAAVSLYSNTGANHQIINNSISGAETGISLGSEKSLVSGNVIVNVVGKGITLSPTAHDSIIDGNFVGGAGSHGIEIFQATKCLISNNRVTRSGNAGIKSAGSECMIIGNIVSDSTAENIDDTGTDNTLVNNLVS